MDKKVNSKQQQAKQQQIKAQVMQEESKEIVQENETTIADPAIITLARSVNADIQTSRNVNEQLGEFTVIVDVLKKEGSRLREQILANNEQLTNAIAQMYGEGAKLAEDGTTIVLPNTQQDVKNNN